MHVPIVHAQGCTAHIQGGISFTQACITHSQGSMDCSQGCLIYILASPMPRGALPAPRSASTMPRAPSPTTLPGWWIRCSTPSAVPSALSPLASSGAAPRLPALILEFLGKYVEYTGVSTRAFPAAVCSGQREALCTPCPWVPANPNKRSRHNGRAEAPARPQRKEGEEGTQNSPTPFCSPLNTGGHTQCSPSTQMGSAVPRHTGAYVGQTPSPNPFPSCSKIPPEGPDLGH